MQNARTPADLRPLASLGTHDLQELTLAVPAVDSSLLSKITHLTGLRRLNLNGTGVDDAAMDLIARLSGLKEIWLGMSQVSAAGLAKLTPLSGIERLDLWNSVYINDEAFVQLKTFPQLKRLELQGTGITDAGMVHFEDMHQLETLFLYDTLVTDDGLAHLRDLGLKVLRLDNTLITDEAVDTLKTLRSLEYLDIQSTRISDQAAAGLRSALRRCRVHHSYMPPRGPKARSLSFPPNRVVGLVTVHRWESSESQWKLLGEAIGSIEVPAGQEVALVAFGEDLSLLSGLEPSALQYVSLWNPGKGAIASYRGLTYLRKQTTLKSVLVEGIEPSDPRLESLRAILPGVGLGPQPREFPLPRPPAQLLSAKAEGGRDE